MMILRNTAVATILFIVCAVQVSAGDGPVLKGKYRVVANGSCTESSNGFSPGPAFQPLGGTTAYSETYTGTMAFDGQGGAIQRIKGMTLFDGPFFPNNSAVGGFEGVCSFTYSMTDELSFTLAGQCSGTLTDGPAASQTYTATGIRVEGQISHDGEQILLAGAAPSEQEILLSGGYQAKRFCIASSHLMRSSKR
jgi:hypothetical protein